MDINDPRLIESHKRLEEQINRLNDMILDVVRAQVQVEGFMIELLKAYGKDPKHFFFTSQKIKEGERINPPEVGKPIWHLLSLCSCVRNELVHSLDDAQIKAKSKNVRDAYLAIAEADAQKESIMGMTDTQVVKSALECCGAYVVVATMSKKAEEKQSA